ncbi:DUF6113 family protein [Actinomadura syzygii]|uniref:Integral membrane protein n=1 Tax=Actinomadura syzygii TaxID=1427538 RepID=A0A5D0U7M5_9ACTN|nr:DUF6113 family protein [Actinomadura syzygii]TYC13685.1 hypothetical protein FXF65_18570 [Actinomadura syzygii]
MDEDDETGVSLAKGSPPAEARPDGEGPLDAVVSGAGYAALGLLGGVVGLLGSFAQGWTPWDVPIAAVAFVALVFAMVRLAGHGMGGRIGAAVPAVVWVVVVLIMSTRRPEGDLVVPGTLAGYVYIIGGLVAATFGVMRVPAANPPGQWLLGKTPRLHDK